MGHQRKKVLVNDIQEIRILLMLIQTYYVFNSPVILNQLLYVVKVPVIIIFRFILTLPFISLLIIPIHQTLIIPTVNRITNSHYLSHFTFKFL